MGAQCTQDKINNEQLNNVIGNSPQPTILTRKAAQQYFIELGLTYLAEKIQIDKKRKLYLNFDITTFDLPKIEIPLDAALIYGSESISFASIYSIQYGMNLSQQELDENAFTIILHDKVMQLSNKQPHIKSNITISYFNPVGLRRYVLSLNYLLRSHRVKHQNFYRQNCPKNQKVIKLQSHKLSARQFMQCYSNYKIMNNDMQNDKLEILCGFLSEVCNFMNEQEYQEFLTSHVETSIFIQKQHDGCRFHPKLHGKYPVFQFAKLKQMLRGILYCPKPDIKESIEAIQYVLPLSDAQLIHVIQQDKEMLSVLIDMLKNVVQMTSFNSKIGNSVGISENDIKDMVGGMLDDDDARDDEIDTELQLLQMEVDNEGNPQEKVEEDVQTEQKAFQNDELI